MPDLRSDPLYVKRERWYLAHPVGAPTAEGQMQNVAAVKDFCRSVLMADTIQWWTLLVPWILRAELTPDAAPEMRRRALEESLAELATCDGLLLTGPAVTDGMRLELREAIRRGIPVINATGIPLPEVAAVLVARPNARYPGGFGVRASPSTVEYADWVYHWGRAHVLAGGCRKASEAMQREFPEMLVVPGKVELVAQVEPVEHWWCVDAFGDVWDPTASQFYYAGGVVKYMPWEPNDPVRVGVCMQCGAGIMANPVSLTAPVSIPAACSPECFEQLKAFYGGAT